MQQIRQKLARFTGETNALAEHYSRFRVGERTLLTGHSHQAWPDASMTGHVEAWLDAAEHVDEKWQRAAERATRVRDGFSKLLGDRNGEIVLGASTHELLVRLFSALPWQERRKVITTDSEFHSARRQFARWAEDGIQWVQVAQHPIETLSERIADEVDDQTLAAFVSLVPFNSGLIVPDIGAVADACVRFHTTLVVDAYHAVNVVPLDLQEMRLEHAFVLGGGYKYCQLGEGNCFLRIPAGTKMRPSITGWYAEMSTLAATAANEVSYGSGADALAGSTYDPTSHYRASCVFDFFAEQELSVPLLRELSQMQIARLSTAFDSLDLPTHVIDRRRDLGLERTAGFLVLETDLAPQLVQSLRNRNILVDARGKALRLGPAPYLTMRQLDDAMGVLGQCVQELALG